MLFRLIALSLTGAMLMGLSACSHDDENQTSMEAGGTIPWNKPASWEGPGVLGSQMQQFNR